MQIDIIGNSEMARMIAKSVYQQWARQLILPQIYQNQWRELQSLHSQAGCLERDSVLQVVSWNIDFSNPMPKTRVAALVHYLQKSFGNNPSELVILLQEVTRLSAQQIMRTKWVQDNFIVIGHEPPRTLQSGIPREAKYYTMVMTPRNLKLQNSFRLPLPSEMGRDALFVDLNLCSSKGRPNSTKEVLRVCTTHLESLQEGYSLRAQQLNLISHNLDAAEDKLRIIAGIIGGDMNAIHHSDRTLHQHLGLKDVWDDQVPWEGKLTRSIKENSSYSQACGHTWGYQSKSTEFFPARLDKFFYRGCVKTANLTNTQGAVEPVRRLGVGLAIDISPQKLSQGHQILGLEGERQNLWVSDHYGICIGVKITK
jgi:tyrosyl-DNA phosphodiesterase 2